MPEFDFNKAVADLNEVPEPYRPLYNPQADSNGHFQVSDQFKPIVTDYMGMSKAYRTANDKNKQLGDENGRRRVATSKFEGLVKELGVTYDDGDADAPVLGLKAYIDDLTAKAANGKDVQINLEKVKKAMQEAHQGELSKKDQEAATLRKSLEKFMIGQVATAALAESKGSVELLLPIITGQCKIVNENGEYVARVVDEAGDYRTGRDAQPMSVKDLVAEMKQNAKYARAFDSEAPRGNGHQPGSGQRPQQQQRPGDRKTMSAQDLIAAGLRKGQASRV